MNLEPFKECSSKMKIKPILCAMMQVPVDAEDNLASCKKNPESFLLAAKEIEGEKLLKASSKMTILLQYQHFKAIFFRELEYISRVSPDEPNFNDLWRQLFEKWQKRLFENPQILNLDQDKKFLGSESCLLHSLFGLSCGASESLGSIILLKKQQLQVEFSQWPAEEKYESDLTYTLLKYTLMKAAQQIDSPSEDEIERAKDNPALQALLISEKQDPNIKIFKDYPELFLNEILSKYLDSVLENKNATHDLKVAISKTKKASQTPKTFLAFYDKINLVERIMRAHFSSSQSLSRISPFVKSLFNQSTKKMFEIFDSHYHRGLTDVKWLYEQSYLLQMGLNWARIEGESIGQGIMQTLICRNAYNQQLQNESSSTRNAILSLIAAGAGIAAFFAPPVAALLFGMTSLTIGLPLTIGNVFTANDRKNILREQFVYGGVDSESASVAEKEFLTSLPLAALSFVMIPSVFLIKYLASLEKAELALQNFEKAKRLANYGKIMSTGLLATGIGMATPQIPATYKNFKLYFEIRKAKAEKLKAEAL